MNKKIFLIGLPGAGKTTMGLDLAHHLSVSFVDLDQEIEKESQQQIGTIFKEKGESHFRQLERKHLIRIIRELPEFVMATGGGTPCFFDNLKVMNESGSTIFINTPIEIIKRRLQHDTTRPLMKSNSLELLYEKRKDWYMQAHKTAGTPHELIQLFAN